MMRSGRILPPDIGQLDKRVERQRPVGSLDHLSGNGAYVVSMDEKTSIQARGRTHEEMPPEPEQTRRIESEYERNGALQYLAAWDVHRGMIMGRCEKKTGIEPFGLLVDQVLEQAPYKDATTSAVSEQAADLSGVL